MRGERVDITEMFDGFRSHYLGIVLAFLLTSAIVGIGFFLLLVPGIIFACRLVFVPYLVRTRSWSPSPRWAHGWRFASLPPSQMSWPRPFGMSRRE